jgi:16S rRNA (guanine527-N7)-methyltransferase
MSRPPALSTQTIALRLLPFNIHLAEAQLIALQKYLDLLLLWNQKISLTSIEDPLEIVSRHFGESIFGAEMLPSPSCRLADVGSGAGFPGLPLKIACPQPKVILIEPNLKKCAFLTEVIAQLDLREIQVFRDQYSAFRAEDARDHSQATKFDSICSRALGAYKSLLQWSRRNLTANGRIILWIGNEDALLLGRSKGWAWEPPAPLPDSTRRVILVGRPTEVATDPAT